MKTKPKKKNRRPWYWPQRRYYVDRHISCPAFAVVRNSDVHCNITVIAECESARNAAALREALNELDLDAHRMRWDRKFRDQREGENFVERVIDTIRRGLAAPARNCDVSRDTKETIDRCLACLNVESSSASFEAGVCAAIGWMLAAPAKGGKE